MYFALTVHHNWDWPHLSAQWPRVASDYILGSEPLDGPLHFAQRSSLSDFTGLAR